MVAAADAALLKKQRMAAKKLPPPRAPAAALRTLEVFDGVSAKIMAELEAIAEPEILDRDAMLFQPGDKAPAETAMVFLITGQVGIGEHTEEAKKSVGKKAKAELFKKVGQTLAVFGHGDFWSDDFAAQAGDLCMYAITECQVLKIKSSQLTPILAKHGTLKDRLKKHAEKWFHRIRYLRESGGRDEVFDFYVKNGFSFSTRTKIRQLELCIDCDKCVVGCEERHGFARLERFGPQVGLINFSVSCRQCYDPRCLIDCNLDAIARDPISHEIRVNISHCTGCSVCARSCPNDSIFVYNITEDMDTSLWEAQGKKVPKKVATKCDRCAGYDDMACISACPTGSMIDATPEDIFGLESAKTIDQSCDTRPFEEGWSEQSTPRALPKVLYGLSAVLLFVCVAEWIWRRWMGDTFVLPLFADEVLGKRVGEGFTSGQGLGYWFGIVGASCMGATLIYVIRNRFEKTTNWMGGKYFWFSFHNALGVLGPAMVFVHGNLLFSKWPAIGVWAAIIVVISGFLGQYLASQLPGKEYRNSRDKQDLDGAITQLSSGWGEHTRSINVAEMMKELEAKKAAADVENMGTFRFLLYILGDDVKRSTELLKLRFGELRRVKNRALAKQTYKLYKEKRLLDRQDRFYKTAGRLVSQWRLFHIFFSVGLFLLMGIHILVVILF